MSLATATRSETTKQFTTSAWWVLALVLLLYIGSTAAALAFVFAATATGNLPSDTAPPIAPEGLAPVLYSTATSVGYVFPLLIGVLIVTGEFRHKTLTPTFLAVPRRGIVLWAKALIGVLMGVLYGLVGVAASVGPSAGFLAAYGIDTELSMADTWALIGRMVLAYALWSLIGVGVGALVRNQVGAIVGVLVFTQFLEPIARLGAGFVEGLGGAAGFLPGALSDALVGASVLTQASAQISAEEPLEWWLAGLVLLGYTVALLVLGRFTTWRADVA